MRAISYFSAVAAFCSFSPSQGEEVAADSILSQAEKAVQEGHFADAAKLYTQVRATKAYPLNVLFNEALAESRVAGHELRAMALFRAYLTAVPNAPEEERVEKAIASLRRQFLKTSSDILATMPVPFSIYVYGTPEDDPRPQPDVLSHIRVLANEATDNVSLYTAMNLAAAGKSSKAARLVPQLHSKIERVVALAAIVKEDARTDLPYAATAFASLQQELADPGCNEAVEYWGDAGAELMRAYILAGDRDEAKQIYQMLDRNLRARRQACYGPTAPPVDAESADGLVYRRLYQTLILAGVDPAEVSGTAEPLGQTELNEALISRMELALREYDLKEFKKAQSRLKAPSTADEKVIAKLVELSADPQQLGRQIRRAEIGIWTTYADYVLTDTNEYRPDDYRYDNNPTEVATSLAMQLRYSLLRYHILEQLPRRRYCSLGGYCNGPVYGFGKHRSPVQQMIGTVVTCEQKPQNAGAASRACSLFKLPLGVK